MSKSWFRTTFRTPLSLSHLPLFNLNLKNKIKNTTLHINMLDKNRVWFKKQQHWLPLQRRKNMLKSNTPSLDFRPFSVCTASISFPLLQSLHLSPYNLRCKWVKKARRRQQAFNPIIPGLNCWSEYCVAVQSVLCITSSNVMLTVNVESCCIMWDYLCVSNAEVKCLTTLAFCHVTAIFNKDLSMFFSIEHLSC